MPKSRFKPHGLKYGLVLSIFSLKSGSLFANSKMLKLEKPIFESIGLKTREQVTRLSKQWENGRRFAQMSWLEKVLPGNLLNEEHMYICIWVCMYIFMHVYVHICIYIHIHIYVCMCVCVRVCVCVCVEIKYFGIYTKIFL